MPRGGPPARPAEPAAAARPTLIARGGPAGAVPGARDAILATARPEPVT